jgi:hypothetical protein
VGGHPVVIEDEATRAEEVYRRWQRTSLDVMGQTSWKGWTPEDAGFVLSMSSAVLLLLLEPALWLRGWPPWSFSPRAAAGLGLLSIVAVPYHGFLLDRFLSAKTHSERSLPRWLLALRFAAACVPLFSFGLLPAWRILLERRPSWVDSRPRSALDLSWAPGPLPAPGRLLRLYTSGFFAVYLALAFALPILWALWLAQKGSPGAVMGVCCALHLVTFAGARRYFAPARMARSTPLLETAPWLCLLPIPAPLLGLVGVSVLEKDREGKEALTWSAWARRSGTGRLPLWIGLESSLRRRWSGLPWFRQWRRPRKIDRESWTGECERATLSFYRGKCALLLLESGALLWALSALAGQFPILRPAVEVLVKGATLSEVGVATLGLLILTAAATARLLGIRSVPPDLAVLGRYLLLTQLALLAGIQSGSLASAGSMKELGLLMAYGGALLAIGGWLFFLPSSQKVSRTSMGWLLSFLLLAFCGIPVGLNEKLEDWPGRLLAGAALLTPVWSLLLFRRFESWLPRPFSWRDATDPRLPRYVRASLAFLGLTAATPGGGLAIPIWIVLRKHLQDFRRTDCV